MLEKDSYVKARINPTLKSHVESVLTELGITMSDAINAFFKQIEMK